MFAPALTSRLWLSISGLQEGPLRRRNREWCGHTVLLGHTKRFSVCDLSLHEKQPFAGDLAATFSEWPCGRCEGLAAAAAAWNTFFCCQHAAQLCLLRFVRLYVWFCHMLAALFDVPHVLSTAWLQSLFFACTNLWGSKAPGYPRQCMPLLHRFLSVECALCSLAQCLQAEWLRCVPDQGKV